jgi:hypothetical protein
MPGDELQLDAFAVDVRDLMSRTVASLYSHLITRPTGRAVRLAIEAQLEELRRPILSLVDFSSVAVLDFSCADEVVAKLLLGLRDEAGQAFVLFRGVRSFHRDPIEAVLDRHRLKAAAETEGGAVELLGSSEPAERRLWDRLEREGRVPGGEVGARLLRDPDDPARLDRLVAQGLLFRHPRRGDLFSLGNLSRTLGTDAPSHGDPSS